MSTRPTRSLRATRRRARLAWVAGLALLLVAPFIGLYPVFMMKALCFAIFACAFNLLLGFTGLLSFGHAAFLGAAAYVTGWLVRSAGLAARARHPGRHRVCRRCSGCVVGLIAIRREGIYFAMITLAMAQMVYFVWLQAPVHRRRRRPAGRAARHVVRFAAAAPNRW